MGIKPLNHAERRAALFKFSSFFMLGMLLLILCVILVLRVPPEKTLFPVASQDTIDMVLVDSIQQKLAAAAAQQSKVNIMLVVDATPGMEAFLPAITQAAEEISQAFKYNMTAACYRDASEGSWLYMSNTMMNQSPISFLKNLDTNVNFDKDEPEALYYGLREALKSPELKKGETNIVMLIGDAGNHAQDASTEVNPSEIISFLVEKNCQFAAIQARHPTSHNTYDEFYHQIKDEIILPASQAVTPAGQQQVQPEIQETATGTTFLLSAINSYLIYTPQQGQALNPEELKNKLISFTSIVNQQILNRVQATQDLSQGKSIPEDDASYHTLLPVLEAYGINSQQIKYLQLAQQGGLLKNVSNTP